jgi:hypothetical protein
MAEKSETPQEMSSLNLDEIDVRELEKRLELSLAGDISNAAWSCCADGGSCGQLTCCEHEGGGGGGGGGGCTSLTCEVNSGEAT